MKVFLCHSNADSDLVLEVAKHLRRCVDGVFYYEERMRIDEEVETTIKRALYDYETMVIFIGAELTEWQAKEIEWAWEIRKSIENRGFCTYLLGRDDFPANLKEEIRRFPRKFIKECSPKDAAHVAADIARNLEVPFFVDGLPLNPHLFDYEKDIIEHFGKASGCTCSFDEEKAKESGLTEEDLRGIRDNRLDGCPAEWPSVVCWKEGREHLKARLGEARITEWQQEFGDFRPEDAAVIAATLSKYHQPVQNRCLCKQGLTFPEAGPREFFIFPRGQNLLKVGILVSGGIAPGINAVIDGIVERHHQYADRLNYSVDVIGLLNGFRGLENLGSSAVSASSQVHLLPCERRRLDPRHVPGG